MSAGEIALSPLQRAILDAPERVRLVRAGPGSGKTRVFVAELQRQFSTWTNHRNGIAALSFTNVAQQEIATRLGGYPPAPHFVGTLDAFLWRFIVRPFAHLAAIAAAGARLVPAPLAQHLDYPNVKVGPEWTGS